MYQAEVTSKRINLSPFTKDYRGAASRMLLFFLFAREGPLQKNVNICDLNVTNVSICCPEIIASREKGSFINFEKVMQRRAAG